MEMCVTRHSPKARAAPIGRDQHTAPPPARPHPGGVALSKLGRKRKRTTERLRAGWWGCRGFGPVGAGQIGSLSQNFQTVLLN